MNDDEGPRQFIYDTKHGWVPLESYATLRDQFAMAALTGIIINETNTSKLAAKFAYEYADAMMEARK